MTRVSTRAYLGARMREVSQQCNCGLAEAASQSTATITPATERVLLRKKNGVECALLYLRPEQVIQVLPVSRRTLSNWQRARRIRFYKVGKVVFFRRCDIETCIEKFVVNPVGEVKPRQAVKSSTVTTELPARKRPAGRIATPPTME